MSGFEPHGALLLLHGALQGVLMTTGEIHHLADLGLCDLVTEDPHDRDTFLVHRQHKLEGLGMAEPEEAFQDMHHELHRCEVIVQQHHLIKRWTLRARLGFEHNARVTIFVMGIVVLRQTDVLFAGRRESRVCSTSGRHNIGSRSEVKRVKGMSMKVALHPAL